MANDRKLKVPLDVIDDNRNLLTNKTQDIEKWKRDYEKLCDAVGESQSFDINHLYQVKQLLENNSEDESIFQRADCSSLNMPVTREEIKRAVYKMKNAKTFAVDEIPAEVRVLKNVVCIEILYKIMFYCFAKSKIPIHKSDDDPRNPLGYRQITLISVPRKVYAHILNARLETWLEENNILCDEQNGFRKDRSCLDHPVALITVQ